MTLSREDLNDVWEKYPELGPHPPVSVCYRVMEKRFKAHLKALREKSMSAKSTLDTHESLSPPPHIDPSTPSTISTRRTAATGSSVAKASTRPSIGTTSSLPSTPSELITRPITANTSTEAQATTHPATPAILSDQPSPSRASPKPRAASSSPSPRYFSPTTVSAMPNYLKEKTRAVYNRFRSRSGDSLHSTQRRGQSVTDKGKQNNRFRPDELRGKTEEYMEADSWTRHHSWQGKHRPSREEKKGEEVVQFHPDQIPDEDKENSETNAVQDFISSDSIPQPTEGKRNEMVQIPPDEISGNEETDSDSDGEYFQSEDEDDVIWAAMNTENKQDLPTVSHLTEEQMMEFQKEWDAGKELYDRNLANGISYAETGQMLFRELVIKA